MVSFAVPDYHSVAHFVLGILLDRASLDRINCDGQHQLTISLMPDDVALLQEAGVVQVDFDDLEATAHGAEQEAAICMEFEEELIALQLKVEAALAKAQAA